jgi:hypothetical protein
MKLSPDAREISTTSSLSSCDYDDDSSSSCSSTGTSTSNSLDGLFFTEQLTADDDNDSSEENAEPSNAEIIIRVSERNLEDDDDDDYSTRSRSSNKRMESSLRRQLRQLRETTDDEYAVAVAMAARDRDQLQRQMDALTKERDDAMSCNKMQQKHADSLTDEVIRLQRETREARDESQRYRRQCDEAQSQMDQLRDGMDNFRKSFEAWIASSSSHNTSSIQEPTTISSSLTPPAIPMDLTGNSPTSTMEELERAYGDLSVTVDETGIPRRKRDAVARRSWPEPPSPIQLPFLTSSSERRSSKPIPTTDDTTTPRRPTTTRSSTPPKNGRERRDDSVAPRPRSSTSKPKRYGSNEHCMKDALLQADFIKEAVQKQRKSTWSNLSQLLREPEEHLGNLMEQVVEFRVDPV